MVKKRENAQDPSVVWERQTILIVSHLEAILPGPHDWHFSSEQRILHGDMCCGLYFSCQLKSDALSEKYSLHVWLRGFPQWDAQSSHGTYNGWITATPPHTHFLGFSHCMIYDWQCFYCKLRDLRYREVKRSAHIHVPARGLVGTWTWSGWSPRQCPNRWAVLTQHASGFQMTHLCYQFCFYAFPF